LKLLKKQRMPEPQPRFGSHLFPGRAGVHVNVHIILSPVPATTRDMPEVSSISCIPAS
jgi:hypothetical protein